MAPVAVTLTPVGGPTVLIEAGGVRLLTDPTFDPPGSYPLPHVTLQKLVGPATAVEEIGRVDAVLLSHDQHSDNLDHAGRALLDRVPVVLTTRSGAARLGGSARGLAPGETAAVAGPDGRSLQVTATPARHGPAGIEPLSGEVVGFLAGVEQPGDLLYVTGDTVWYQGVAEVARRYRPRLVILFAGAARTRGAMHLTMDANDALEAAHAFPDAWLFAAHTDGWAHFTESGAELARAFATVGLTERLTLLQPGQPVRLEV